MEMTKADVLVIGGGPGGYLAAERAAQGGLKVVLFEKRALGGVCLNEGCIPTKAFLNSGKLYVHAKESEEFGVHAENVTLDQKEVLTHKNKVVKKLVKGVEATMKANGVKVINAEAKVEKKTEEGFLVRAGEESYVGDRLILACGSTPVLPPIPGLSEGLESGFVTTSRELLDLEETMKRLVVIGGGIIGLEMACYFSMIGVDVTVIEMLDKIAGPTDREVSEQLMRECEKRGIHFLLSCQVTGITPDGVLYKGAEKEEKVEADRVLCSIGRRALIQDAGLESLGIYVENGAVVTDEHLQTNVAGAYAIGDINGKSMLAHTAYREAEVAVNHILGKKDFMRYNAVPSVIYTDPEVACVGETAESAEEKGYSVKVITTSMQTSGRYVAEVNQGSGFCKLVVDTKKNCLLGAHLIGSYTSEIIYGLALMIETEMPTDHIRELVFPHPTVSEVIREALAQI